MGNFFATLPLLDKLTDMGMYRVGTTWGNRLQGAPLEKKAALQKETRGTFDYIWWKQFARCLERETKVVIVVTNSLPLNPVSSTKRWSKAEKKHVDVTLPNLFKEYNANVGEVLFIMGGVIFIWTVPVSLSCANPFQKVVVAFSVWPINATAVNAWGLFRKIHWNNIPLLTFLRELVVETLGKCGRNRPAHSLNISVMAGTSKKFDTLNVVVKGESKYCRCQ